MTDEERSKEELRGELEALKARCERAERRANECEHAFEALKAAIPDMMFRINRGGKYLDFVPAKGLEPVLRPELFLKRNIRDVMPPEFAETAMHYVTLALETGQTQVYEYELPLHGSPHRYQARVAVSGRDEVLALVRDITGREEPEGPRK